MRGRRDTLQPLEDSILTVAREMANDGEREFYGYLLANRMQSSERRIMLPSRGGLYKALNRLTKMGLLTSQLEAPEAAAAAGRPRRRYFQLTGLGERAFQSERVRGAAPAEGLAS